MKFTSSKLILVLTFAIALCVSLLGCDPCKDVVCVANASCNEGTCVCAGGYEGPNCDSLSYIKFEGSYLVSESCQQGGGGGSGGQYNSTILQGFQVEQVEITNILNSGLNARAEVQGNTIIVLSQELGSFHIEGQGTYESQFRRIRLNVEHNRNNVQSACTLTMSKQ